MVYGRAYNLHFLDMLGGCGYILASVVLLCVVAYHLLLEAVGIMNSKSSMGYELLMSITTATVLIINLKLRFVGDSSATSMSFISDTSVATIDILLLYVAVTHEFKWVCNFR